MALTRLLHLTSVISLAGIVVIACGPNADVPSSSTSGGSGSTGPGGTSGTVADGSTSVQDAGPGGVDGGAPSPVVDTGGEPADEGLAPADDADHGKDVEAGAPADDGGTTLGDDGGHVGPANGVLCHKVEPKDWLISQLVEDSWITRYPLTRLTVTEDGTVTGPALPDALVGDLEIIHTVPEALAAVVAAIRDIRGKGPLPDYGIGSMTRDGEACPAVPAWTPLGTTTIATSTFVVSTDGTHEASWKKTRTAFGKVCPLVRVRNDKDAIDPPSDGSTNLPADNFSVFTNGVRANAFGLCATGTPYGTNCMLSYATGLRYQGRWCQYYSGSNRCVLK